MYIKDWFKQIFPLYL